MAARGWMSYSTRKCGKRCSNDAKFGLSRSKACEDSIGCYLYSVKYLFGSAFLPPKSHQKTSKRDASFQTERTFETENLHIWNECDFQLVSRGSVHICKQNEMFRDEGTLENTQPNGPTGGGLLTQWSSWWGLDFNALPRRKKCLADPLLLPLLVSTIPPQPI